ncbi:MAG: hypothetical protein ACYTDY_06580 [Planctomycetota bacterium]|jgi:chromosome segregation ATPase
MRRQAIEQLGSVIRANTERRSLEELMAAGKRHVRVVSSDKVIELIKAIVDDAIEREACALVERDRNRMVTETQQEFDRVVRIQAEQDAEVKRYRELSEHYQNQAQEAEQRLCLLTDSIEESIEARDECEHRILRLEADLIKTRQRLEAGEEERVKARKITENALERCLTAEARLERSRARLDTASATIANYDQEFERLASDLESERLNFATLEEESLARVRALQAEVGRLEAELEGRDLEIEVLRSESAEDQLTSLRDELGQMKDLVRALAERPAGADARTIETLVSRLAEHEGDRASELEERFNLQLERALDEVARTLRLATAKPVDVPVEATDVLVERIFDQEDEMRTNLDSLDVEERSSRRKISSNLARLKEAHLGREKE